MLLNCLFIILIELIVVRGADLSVFFFSLIFVCKMYVFVSRPLKIVTFLKKTVTPKNNFLIFFQKETHSETKSWKSSRISTKKVPLEIVEDFALEAKIHHFSLFSIFFFFSIFSFFFDFFIVPFFHFFVFFFFFRFFFFFFVFSSFSFFQFFSLVQFFSFSFF